MKRQSSMRCWFPCLIAGVLTLGGCGDDHSSQPSMAAVKGRVTGDDAFSGPGGAFSPAGVEGATVTLARFRADGSLETLAGTSVQTDSEGRFTMTTDLDGERGLVAVAGKGSATWMAVISSEVKRGRISVCQPVNAETDVEAAIRASLEARGTAGMVSQADVAATVDADLSAELSGEDEAAAAALEAHGEAQADALNRTEIGLTGSDLVHLRELRAEVLAGLEADLYAGADEPANEEAALEAFLEADLDAFEEAGARIEDVAFVRAISARAATDASVGLSSDSELLMTRQQAMLRARAVARAVIAAAVALGANADQRDDVASANGALLLSVEIANSEEAMEAAFRAHHDAVLDVVQEGSSHGLLIASADGTLNGAVGPIADLELDLALASTVNGKVDAFFDFRTTVRALVDGALVSAQEDERRAAADCLLLLNLPS